MKELPILFSGAMVRAIRAGVKTQTRRLVKWKGVAPGLNLGFSGLDVERFESGAGPRWKLSSRRGDGCWEDRSDAIGCRYGQPGDRLWVREATHRRPMLNLLTGEPLAPEHDGGAYTADDEDVLTPEGFDICWWYPRRACPSIHMPRWASRETLLNTGVRIERLTAISEEDARAEGIVQLPGQVGEPGAWWTGDVQAGPELHARTAKAAYRKLWEHLNGAGSWELNPHVWVTNFNRLPPP